MEKKIESILKIPIHEVIGRHVELKKIRDNYIGLCPFHEETTPSFTVSPEKGIYKCFGCGMAGGVINFVMEYWNFTYDEAVQDLKKYYENKDNQIT